MQPKSLVKFANRLADLLLILMFCTFAFVVPFSLAYALSKYADL